MSLRKENERLLAKVIELQGKLIEAQIAHMETLNKLTRKIVKLQSIWREPTDD